MVWGIEFGTGSVDHHVGFHVLEDSADCIRVGKISNVIRNTVEMTRRLSKINGVKMFAATLREEPEDLASETAAATGDEDVLRLRECSSGTAIVVVGVYITIRVLVDCRRSHERIMERWWKSLRDAHSTALCKQRSSKRLITGANCADASRVHHLADVQGSFQNDSPGVISGRCKSGTKPQRRK